MRATRVVVLPEPAGATHRTGPGGAVAAARWSAVNRSSRATTSGCGHRRSLDGGRFTADSPRLALRAMHRNRDAPNVTFTGC